MKSYSRRLGPVLAALAATCLPGAAALAGGTADTEPAAATASIVGSTDRMIVRLRDTEAGVTMATPATRVSQLGGRLGASLQRLRGMSGNAQVLQLPRMHSRAEAAELARQLALDPDVLYAEPDLRMVPLRVPNDTSYGQQWHYFEPAGGINLPAAWDRTVGSAGITVGVIDTGLVAHPDLAGRTVAGYDFITNTTTSQDGNGRDADASDPGDFGCNGSGNSSWHGTHVAGTIGAATDNGQGVAGVNWTSKVQPLRALGRCGGYTSDIVDAMRWAAGIAVAGIPANATPARVLNLSLGGGSSCGTSYQNAINDVVARGTVVVVAAGNSNKDAATTSPASCNGVITVGATTRSGARAGFSNYGPKVAISAPGVSVLSTLNSGTSAPAAPSYAWFSGTSMATPHVAGVVSLMLSLNPALTPAQVLTALKSSARAFPVGTGADCTTALCGAGIVDAAAALAAAAPVPPPPPQARANLALPSAGATISASSSYNAAFAPTGANNGDRKGQGWGAGGGWNDASANAWGDWLQVDFGSTKTVAEVDVFTIQDNYASPVEPTETSTFTQYGITDFEVQYWDGSAWQTVPGGSVAGNNRVWRRFTFTPVSTSRIRVLVLGALGGYCRITELEAYATAATAPPPTAVNHASQAAGAVAQGSTTYSMNYGAAGVNNGDRRGTGWGSAGGGWNDATAGAWPDSIQVGFNGSKVISEIDVFTVQDSHAAPVEPTQTMTFSLYGITQFDVQTWNGSAWVTVPGGAVTGNNRVWRKFSFPALTTNAVRVLVHGSLGGYTRITEIEAYGPP